MIQTTNNILQGVRYTLNIVTVITYQKVKKFTENVGHFNDCKVLYFTRTVFFLQKVSRHSHYKSLRTPKIFPQKLDIIHKF